MKNHSNLNEITKCLSNIGNMPKILSLMRQNVQVADWKSILKFSFSALKIKSLVSTASLLLHRLVSSINPKALKDISYLINSVIDFDESAVEGKSVVKSDVDETLDELKQKFFGLDDFLSSVAKTVSETINASIPCLNVIYFPQLGYLITIPTVGGTDIHDIEGLHFQFCTKSTVYYKNSHMFELDEVLGDLHSIIADKELEIVQLLTTKVLQFTESINETAHALADLDWYCNF